MIRVQKKNSPETIALTLVEFEEMMGFEWVGSLQFQTPLIQEKIYNKTSKTLRKKKITEREKFLGVNFHEEIVKGIHPDVSIRYIDERIGYGVFAETAIPAGSFIGEYTGVLRKRKGRPDRKNDYCFEYDIGKWLLNPYIIDAKEKGNITRFINHGAEPNLESVSVYADGLKRIILIAIQPISKGTQLTYDYGSIYWKKRRNRLVDNF